MVLRAVGQRRQSDISNDTFRPVAKKDESEGQELKADIVLDAPVTPDRFIGGIDCREEHDKNIWLILDTDDVESVGIEDRDVHPLNILLKLVHSNVLIAAIDCNDEQLRNIYAMSLTLEVSNKGIDFKDEHPSNMLFILITLDVSNRGTDTRE